MLTRGKNKGETCGKKNVKGSHFCTTHNKKSDETEKEPKKETEKENKKENKEVEKQTEKEDKEVEKSCECKYILTRGKNKGDKCGKKTVKDAYYCATHNKKEESESEGEKEEKTQRKRKEKVEVNEEVKDKKDEKVEEVIEVEDKEVVEDKIVKKEVNGLVEKAKQLEQKLIEQKQKDENDLKLKKIEEE